MISGSIYLNRLSILVNYYSGAMIDMTPSGPDRNATKCTGTVVTFDGNNSLIKCHVSCSKWSRNLLAITRQLTHSHTNSI